VEDFKEQVGSLIQLTAEHGLLSQAVSVALAQNDSSSSKLQSLEEELLSFSEELGDETKCSAMIKDELMTLLNRVLAAATKHALGLERRLYALESVMGSDQHPSLGAASRAQQDLSLDTSFGITAVGNALVKLTMNTLVSML
jgi:hypothetical protein